MSEEEITALAREYAEIHCPEFKYRGDKEGRKDDIKYETLHAQCVIEFLLRRYCLVEKERVKAELKAVDLSIKASLTFILKVTEVDMAKKELLHSLFPEIAKEVEE